MTSPYGVSLWRYIRSGWLNFSKLLVYDVGDGTRVKFWKHVWLKLWVGLLGDFTRMCNFIIHHKIGKKKHLINLWGWSILRQCGGLAQIRFVGSLQGTEVLRLKDIIALSTLLLLFHSHRE